MFTEQEIMQIIHQQINRDEKLGDQTGGSGHMGYVSYKLKNYSTRPLSSDRLEIEYSYCTYVETEFTYYPDNPPMEFQHSRRIVIDRDKKIVPKK